MLRRDFCFDWLFWNDRTPDVKTQVQLPHDAMLTEKRLPGLKNGTTTGFFPGGKYHYEKHFFGREEWAGKHIAIAFDGIYMNSTVFLNGKRVGGRIYGYSHFVADLTGEMKIGQDNVLHVIADNTRTTNSRWYSGSGIYRQVDLLVGGETYIPYENLRIETLSIDPAVVKITFDTCDNEKHYDDLYAEIRLIEVGCINGGDYGYQTEAQYNALYEAEPILTTQIPVQSSNSIELNVPNAKLWDVDQPNLYAVVIKLREKSTNQIVDEERNFFGIRSLTWGWEKGLCVNGNTVKLKGACIHHDNGMLGACEHPKALLRKIHILKQVGFNAVRTAHHPASRALMDACDVMGMYVFEESFDSWRVSKNEYDYSIYFDQEWKNDLLSMVVHSYNHPSVIMYGLGNEISDLGTERGAIQNKEMAEFVRSIDRTRPITNAGMYAGLSPLKPLGKENYGKKKSPDDIVDPYLEEHDGIPKGSLFINTMVTILPILVKLTTKAKNCAANSAPLMAPLDICGFNYANIMMDELHELCPHTLLLNSETYPNAIGHNWPGVLTNPGVVGDFMWTGWDYLGEVGAGVVEYGKKYGGFNKPYPCVAAGLGPVDMTGFIEAEGLFASVAYRHEKNPRIGVRPINHFGEKYFIGQWRGTDAVSSWSWEGQEGKKAEVEVYSYEPLVELFVNGASVGKQKPVDCKAKFVTTYSPGVIRAVAYDENGQETGNSELRSASPKTQITLLPEQTSIAADGKDLAYVAIHITDEKGFQKALSDRRVWVEVSGAGTLAGLGSGNPKTTDDFCGNTCLTWYGRTMAVIRSNGQIGDICIKVKAENLPEKQIIIKAK